MEKDKLISILTTYFESKSSAYNLDMAFLYGSWSCGYPKDESDVDIAVIFTQDPDIDKIFEITNNISLELTDILKKETNVLYIDKELSKPMLYYNAIIHGIPVYIKDFSKYVNTKLYSILGMEDFRVFGVKWQSDLVKIRLEAMNARI